MRTPTTLAAYAAALAVVFGSAVGIGNAVGPTSSAERPPAHSGPAHGAAGEPGAGATRDAGGLATSQDGYRLELLSTPTAAARAAALSFRITGPDGAPLTEYVPEHEKDLHLVVVRRDLTGYQHLHPTRDAQGRWAVPLALAEPGPYKVYADFQPAGRDRSLVLAADLTAAGDYTPQPLPAPSGSTSVDGYDVSLEGTLVAGTSSRLTLTVQRDGQPVTDLEPYLGAYGHLVALREGDLAYLHVHPDGGTTAGPDVTFSADVASPATYRLFLDFAHGGEVRTAELTATASRSSHDQEPR